MRRTGVQLPVPRHHGGPGQLNSAQPGQLRQHPPPGHYTPFLLHPQPVLPGGHSGQLLLSPVQPLRGYSAQRRSPWLLQPRYPHCSQGRYKINPNKCCFVTALHCGKCATVNLMIPCLRIIISVVSFCVKKLTLPHSENIRIILEGKATCRLRRKASRSCC
jgi:hypothetical protein